MIEMRCCVLPHEVIIWLEIELVDFYLLGRLWIHIGGL